jgi:dolichol-phosphate mannosyltransferase
VISIVVPTYNERDNITRLLEGIVAAVDGQPAWEILVVDDASPDGTAAVVTEMSRSEPRVRLLARSERGLAGAVRVGCEAAQGDTVVVMDSDFNHPPALVPVLLGYLAVGDLIVGSRYVPNGGMRGSQLRYLLSGLYNLWIRTLLRLPTRDNLSGFLAFRKNLLAPLPPERVFLGYGDYCIRLIQAIHRAGGRIIEVPVMYGNRPEGASKTRFLYHFLTYTRTVFELLVRPIEVVRA